MWDAGMMCRSIQRETLTRQALSIFVRFKWRFTHSFADIHVAAIFNGNFALIIWYLRSGCELRHALANHVAFLDPRPPSQFVHVVAEHDGHQEEQSGEGYEYRQYRSAFQARADDPFGRLITVRASIHTRRYLLKKKLIHYKLISIFFKLQYN